MQYLPLIVVATQSPTDNMAIAIFQLVGLLLGIGLGLFFAWRTERPARPLPAWDRQLRGKSLSAKQREELKSEHFTRIMIENTRR